MCTVTVVRPLASKQKKLIVTMNRDERRDRLPEIALDLYQEKFLYPVDSEAQGTWCGANQFGLSLCLLNRYDEIAYEPSKSRGLLIPSLLACETLEQLKLEIVDIDLSVYAPFTLFVNNIDHGELLHWDGKTFIVEKPFGQTHTHFSSSSWNAKRVLPWREREFTRWAEQGASNNKQGMPTYNLLQPKGEEAFAPFVSRDNAYTKSITQFIINDESVEGRYWPEEALPKGDFVQQTIQRL